jgi:hypothetical protein
MDLAQIEERLLFTLRDARGQEAFTGDSAIDLFLVIREGARRIAAEGATSEDHLKRAEAALLQFVNQMAVERDQLGLAQFHEITVSGARSKLCPGFWPFC